MRAMQVDNVKIYRYLLTRTMNGRTGQHVVGPYATKANLTHWRNKGEVIKIELQQLAVNIERPSEPILEWVTLKVTTQEDEQ